LYKSCGDPFKPALRRLVVVVAGVVDLLLSMPKSLRR
jgi:hypothetical protein